jgi:hypothetical protein
VDSNNEEHLIIVDDGTYIGHINSAVNGHSPTRRFIKYRQFNGHAVLTNTPGTDTLHFASQQAARSTTNTFFKSKLGWILGSGFKTSNSPRRHHRVQLNHRHKHQLHVPHRGRIHVGFHKHIHNGPGSSWTKNSGENYHRQNNYAFGDVIHVSWERSSPHTHISVKRIYNGYPYNSSAFECHRSQRSDFSFTLQITHD